MDSKTVVVICGFILQIMQVVVAELRYASQCFNHSKMEFSCGQGQMIRIHSMYYGYNGKGSCMYNDDDCLAPDQQHYACSGRRTCVINLSNGIAGKYLAPCKKRATYYLVNYKCVPENEVTNICAVRELTSQRGYISTPNYPLNYNKPLNCTMTLKIPYKGQEMELNIIDFNIHPVVENMTCTDKLYVKTMLHSSTICGPTQNSPLNKGTMTGDITLTFQSTGPGSHKGFWLHYQALPYIKPKPTTTRRTTTVAVSTVVPSVSVIQVNSEDENDRSLPVNKTDAIQAAAIIAGILGTLLLVLFILVVLLIIKRRKERAIKRIPSSSSRSELYGRSKQSSFKQRAPPLHIHHNICVVHDELMAHR